MHWRITLEACGTTEWHKFMHLSTASPGGTTPGHTKGKREILGSYKQNSPRDTEETKKFAFAFLEGERRGGFFMS